MAIDGSFGVEYELQRFLLRCPKLAAAPQLDNLVEKGKILTEKELIDGVAELLLHPRYTIPLLGCFRPIARKVVDRVVALLHLVPDLTSNSNDSMIEFDDGRLFKDNESSDYEQDISVINLYVKYGRGLGLHELSCLAFSRTLDMLPYLTGSVKDYFKFAPPPFKRMMEKESMAQSLSLVQPGTHLLDAVRVSYRLLLAEPEVFAKLWDWSCYMDLIHEITSLNNGENTEILMDIRWCAVQTLTMVLNMSDKFIRKSKTSDLATSDFGFDDEKAYGCLLRWKEFLQDVSLEKAGWYLEPFGENTSVGQPNWSNMEAKWDTLKTGSPFVLTSAVKKSFEMRWPVLLYGPAGAGKTALISRLAQGHGSQVLSIHMDEQIDGKTLIGTYVCAEQPGEFRWQPGSLTQDIDKAPADVQSILLPLLEGATSFLTGHGEAIRVSESFRLFSTVSSSRLDASSMTTGRNSLGALWRRVMIGSSSSSDLESILKAWYPDLESLCGKLIETFEKVNHLTGFQLGTCVTLSSAGRFSLRDLLKWCKIIAGLGFHFMGERLSGHVAKCIYQEAVDVFATSSSSVEARMRIMRELAEIWGIPISDAETLFPVDKPDIQDLRSDIRIGRVTLQLTRIPSSSVNKSFVEIRTSMHILERIAGSVKYNEPVLLVGETGTGKTTLVQNLAARLGQKLTVLNLSQQSDVADLLGGFKPMNAQFLCLPLYQEFENLFRSTFSSKDKENFLAILRKSVSGKNWNVLFSGLQKGVRTVVKIGKQKPGVKRKRPLGEKLIKSWEKFSLKLEAAHGQINASDGMVFSFVEGVFITALKNGDWILLDEINLAPPETLQRVIGVLEDEGGSLCLAERGDVDYISRHPNFRIFACMNPATDAGKRDLPLFLRNRFTEYFMDDVLEDEDLKLFINRFMEAADNSVKDITTKILKFYKIAKKESEERLQDGANQKPQYSLRSVYRAMEYTKKARRAFGFLKAIYDGFSMFFLTMLDPPSANLMKKLITGYLLDGKDPTHVSFDRYIVVGKNTKNDEFLENYVLTKSVRDQLSNLACAIFIGRYPVLLQGPTSSGKTSLVQYLAAITGHEFVRINNHEHTDLQEYLGSYITDASGRLVFQEGVLVKAVRNGHWIVLDELNLAPSDVLEALNRLLDDNRELYVPELCETIHAHPDFMLFATQNPPTFYGGRKMLSRAFRNRFVEIHVDEIPQDELSTILENRCKIPGSYAKKMIEVMIDLQKHRQSSKVFAGKHGYITPRDLFRWADRFRMFGKSYEDLGRDGYYLFVNLFNVLDRINSLVEQSGSITVNECGTIEGKPMVLHPHPQFRMFLTVNPTYGEVSRAMRNRGVEIYMMQPYGENELIDVKRFLALSDIPGEHLVNAMAKAHLSAKRDGLKHNVSISNLELMRWVQLFQRLVTNGNQATWSLKISFEHTYLSSLGEIEGKDIINEAISCYLSTQELHNCSSLCLPGGWPTTLNVRDFVWYSRETSVKQNCMYLEYLAAQMASHSFRASFGRMDNVLCPSDSMRAYLVDLETLHAMTFPKADVAGLDKVNQTELDFAFMNKRLLFAANWTMEQATESDLKLYLGDHLNRHCSFFSSFRKLLEKELDHSIWNCIRTSHGAQYSSPMLSLDFGKSTPSESESNSRNLSNAVKCVGLLRVSYQQWHNESEFKYSEQTRCFIPVLQSLKRLEERILDMLVESPFFDVLFVLYKELINDHLSAWNGLVSCQYDCMLISWRSLVKDAKKLKEFCANEVENFQRSLLWAYGGHPYSPSSVEIYRKQQQLVNLCHSIWTKNINLQELAHKGYIEAAVATNPELRFLAMQGVCMSAFIMSKVDEDDHDVLNQLEEMYQVLSSKFHYEKDKMERNAGTNDKASLFGALSSCCTMNPDMLCLPSGFNCWLDTLPLNDNNSFGLDMRLLQELSNIITLDGKDLESGLSRLRWLLESTLKFSLNSSSRPPTDFSPYQKISWVLEAWTSVNNAHASISSTVLEMWFNWHTSLWKHHSNREKKNSSQHGNADLVPDMLFQPVATLALDKILGNPIGIKDLNAHSLKLGVASRNLWLSSPHVADSHSFFLSSARSLFQQIILAHERSFEADKYSLIKSIFFSAQQADVRVIISLLASSTHHVLKSLIRPFIEPLLHALYVKNSADSLFDLGCAWLHIGGLRYHLLLCCDDVDPAVKKNLKYFQLTERIASLELDIEVRKECVQLAGCFSLSEADKEKTELLNDLKAERNRLQKQVVFRSDPRKFKKLRSECDEFMKLVATPFDLLKNIGNLSMQGVADQVHNWQETATRFVDRLSNEYSEYVDIVQPVQIAIYEMKLGLSLVLSNSLRDQFLDRVGQKDIDVVLGAIYSFMRFPRGISGKDDSCVDDSFHVKLSSFDKAFPTYIGEADVAMVETLVTSAKDNNSDEVVC
uniref:Midasin n=1 Tax=Lactuca sativa TaxID=4236 RepID=A0A9R1UX06_LACSA|nr:hypothetical protein LSAT_V11C700343310 [Lactuca sativa]